MYLIAKTHCFGLYDLLYGSAYEVYANQPCKVESIALMI